MAYIIPPGDQCNINFSGAYNIPPGGQCIIHFGADGGHVEEPHAMLLHGLRMPWKRLRPVDGCCRIPWRQTRHIGKPVRVAWQDTPPVKTRPVRLPWRSLRPLSPAPTRIPWRDYRHVNLPGVRAPWYLLGPVLLPPLRLPWQETAWRRDRATCIPWCAPPALRLGPLRAPWQLLAPHNRAYRIPWWARKPARDMPYRLYWGRELYERICLRGYDLPDGGNLVINIHESLSQVGDGDHCNIWFESLAYDIRCRQREPSGWRDNYLYPLNKWPKADKLEVLIVLNTALLTRVLDGAPVEVFGMEIAADMDSWCWSFSARVPEASLDMVMPLAEPVAVDATINGYTWRILIESWAENHAFARREYTIRGRSLSAYLTEPYAAASSGSNEAAANAQQLAAQQLEYTGWTLQWGIVDWLVPVGALSYSNATPLKIIQQIAEAAGGRIMTHPTAQQLIILPRLVDVPWKWSTAIPSMGINEYVVRTLSRQFQAGVGYDAVIVSGENQGVQVKVYRRGTEGAEMSPMVTDALITATEPAVARGKLIIGQSGKWSKEHLALPLTRPGILPGLLELGTLVSMEEHNSVWRGQVVGIKVTASWDNAFTVQQDVAVERYRGT